MQRFVTIVHEKKFQDFGIDFEIEQQENSPVALQNLFNKEIQNIDSVLFDYYQKISENFDSYYFVSVSYTHLTLPTKA